MSHRPPARLLIETLEPRILYSADLMPLAAGTNAPNITEQRILTPADSNTTSHELVFIDARVDGYQSLIDNIVANTTSERPIEIIVITADEDGVSRISETLASRQGISAIHLISHGDAGRIQLGNAWLDNQQLLQRADEIARWGNAMGGESDFLIYGCDVAASDAGKTLLANLAHLTGADVAASNDLTGSAARGGDWTLEVSTGSIETGTLTENTWNGLLAANTAPSFNIGDGLSAFVSGSANGVATRITYQSDGKYLMSGYVLNGANYDMALARYNADGTLDTSFNGTGQVITTVSTGNDYGNTVKVQADGKIVVVGYASNGVNDDIVVLRYNANGTLDTSFNGIGGVITAIGLSDDRAVGLALQSDGKIVVAGLTAGATLDFALVRYNSNGTLDTSFNGTGIVVTAVGGGDDWGWDVAVQSDGKIVVTGQSSNGLNQDVALLRYNSNGTLDTSFNGVGGVTTAIGAGDDYGNNVTLQSDGKIIVGGYSFNGVNYDAALLRYNSNGTLDTSFNGTGKFTISLSTGNDYIWGVAVQSDGKIVAVGQSNTGADSDIAVLRLNSNGTLDTSFNSTGIRKSGIAGNNDGGLGVEVLSDGRIAVGCYSALGADASFIVLRLNADGSPDLTLDAAAAVPFTEGGSAVVLNSGLQLFDAELSALNNFNGATLTLARNGGANSQDVFSASGTLGTLTQGGNLVVGGTIIGTVTTNASGTLLLTFNANATNALVNSAMQQIAYSNSSDAPPASVQIDWTFSDGNSGAQGTGGALAAAGSTTTSITAVNDAPTAIVTDASNTAEQILNTYTTSDQSEPSLAALPSGGFVAVWTSNGQDGSSSGVYGQRYDSAGNKVGSEFQVNTTTFDGQNRVRVTAFADGGFVVSYTSAVSSQYAWPLARVYNADGTAATGEIDVRPGWGPYDEGYNVNIQTLDNNRFVAVWSNSSGGLATGLEARIYDRSGNLQGSQFTVSNAQSRNELYSSRPSIALLADGGFAVGWLSDNGTTTASNLRLFNSDGSARTTALSLGGTGHVSLSTLANGNLVAAYEDGGDINAQIINASGTVVQAEFSVNAGAGNQTLPSVTRSGSDFVVAWQSDTGDGSGQGVYAQRFDSNGVSVGTAVRVNTVTAGNQEAPVLIETTYGQVRAAWQSDNNDGSSYGIVSRVLGTNALTLAENSVNGTRVADVLGVFDVDAGDTFTYSLANDAGGRFAINSSTGVITVANGTLLDFETTTSHSITVRATDAAGLGVNQILTVTLTDANEAPVLNDTALSMTLAEDAGVPSGAVGSLISAFTGGISDVDSGALTGIAITATDETNGTWYYTVNGGTNWTAVGAVSSASALLLANDASTRLYFAPAANFNGSISAGLTLRAWDQTSGTAASKVSTASNGGSTAFSSASDTVNVTVTAVNDAPVLTLNGSTTVSIDEGQVVMPFYARISTTDADSADFNGGTLTVSISGGQQAADELYITGGNIAGVTVSGNNVMVAGITIGTWAGGTGGTPLTVTFNANAILSSVDTLLNVITYTNTSNTPVSGARIISVSVSDGDGGTSNTVTGNVTLSAINNPPASTGGSVTGTEDTALVFNWSDFNVSDVDTAIGADSAIRITSMPANGSLQYFDGSTWISASLNQVFTKARIDAGYLRFMPAQDQSGSDTNANPGLGNGFNDYAQFGFEPLQTTAIAINNPDAEANIYPDGNWSNTATGWTVQGPAGSQNPAAANFPLDNDNALFTDAGGSLEQTLATTFSSSNNYSLSLEVGSTYASGTYSFEVQIYAGSTQIGVMNQSNFMQINSQFVSGTLTIDGSSYAALDGQALQICLVGLTAQAFYDNLTLSSYARASDIGSGATMNIDIVAVNDAPSITSNGGGTTANVNAAENQTAVTTVTATDPDSGATQTYSISGGADAALFSINSTTGVLTFNSGQNFESTADANADGIYEVTVQVDDGLGGSDTQAISVTVTNVNETPSITSNGGGTTANVNAAENQTAVTTVTATDPDAGATQTYSVAGGADAALFSINSATGVLTFNSGQNFESTADANTDGIYEVTVQVDDGLGGSDTQAISVTVTNVNEAPSITSNGGGATSNVNVAENQTAVTTVTATDPDAGATQTYSVAGGADAALFSINSATGVLTFNSGQNFESTADANTDGIYEVTVQVDDGLGGSDTQAISVTVTNVNEAPSITSNGGGATSNVNVAENQTAVTTVTATDPDAGATQTYSVAGGADAALFSINSATGVLTFNSGQNFESTADANTDGIYEVTVQVDDGQGGSDTQAISVTVTNVNEAPSITSNGGGTTASINAANKQTIVTTVTASDPDAGTTLSYSISGGVDAALFSINSVTGVLTFNSDPNFASTADANADGIYEVTVQVDDGNSSDNQAIAVTLARITDNTPITPPPTTLPPSSPPAPDLPAPPPPPVTAAPPTKQSSPPPSTSEPDTGNSILLTSHPADLPPNTEIQSSNAVTESRTRSSEGSLASHKWTSAYAKIQLGKIDFSLENKIAGNLGMINLSEQPHTFSVEQLSKNSANGIDEEVSNNSLILSSSAGVAGAAFSIGIIWWTARAGGLLASLAMALPTWRNLDPLSVLGASADDSNDWGRQADEEDIRDERAVTNVLEEVTERRY